MILVFFIYLVLGILHYTALKFENTLFLPTIFFPVLDLPGHWLTMSIPIHFISQTVLAQKSICLRVSRPLRRTQSPLSQVKVCNILTL